MEAHKCKLERKTHIGFLDPMLCNEKSCIGDGTDVTDTRQRLAKAFKACEHKETILLAYNCEYVFP